MRLPLLLTLILISAASFGQYVWPKAGYNTPEPGLYTEDPFIIQYRKEFFAVFRGDFPRFEKALKEIEAMVEANPNDARATVWKGNGRMVQAGLALIQNKTEEAKSLYKESNVLLDRAVRLTPEDPNIYMMRAATLLLFHQRFPREWNDRRVYERLRDDSLKFIEFIGPYRFPRTSIHLQGEALASLAIAYQELGLKSAAVKTWQRLVTSLPKTEYATKGRKELEALGVAAVSAES